MTNEKLNTELYKKLFAEQEQFKGWLLTQPPDEILNHAYEYSTRIGTVVFHRRIRNGQKRNSFLTTSTLGGAKIP